MTKILLIEDNEMNVDMLSRRLERSEFNVVVALDGEQGLEAAHAELPDLILLDMSLPIIDGWEVVRQLKSTPDTRPIPVIALTAHAVTGDRERCLDAGCDEYESKPIKYPQLLDKIHNLLNARQY